MFAELVVTFTLIYNTVLIGILVGRPWQIFSFETVLTKVVPVTATAFFMCAQLAAWELCGAPPQRARAEPTFKVTRTPADVLAMMSTPLFLFIALFVQGVMQVVSSPKVRTLIVTPAVAVHAMTALYYVGQVFGPSCTLVTHWPLAQAAVNPLHYALWISSVSSQVMTLFGLGRALSPSSEPGNGELVATVSHRRACIALLSVEAMLWFGALGDAYQGDERVNLLAILLSFGAFYTLLATGLYLPLLECYRRERTSDDPGRKRRATSYRFVCAYLVLAWHCFPLIWMCNVLGWATESQVEVGFVVCDVLAKFLPPSLYLTVATAE